MTQVSVLVPIKADDHQDVTWLCQALDSVLIQSYSDWEVIVVNDHSPIPLKDSKELRARFRDSRISGVKATKHGVANARNQAAEKAEGKFLLAFDADDELPPNALQLHNKHWPGDGITYGDTLLFGPNFRRSLVGKRYDFRLLLDVLYLPVGSMHLKEAWRKVGGWKPAMENGLEDWEYWIALGEIGVCGHYIPEVTYHYRRHPRGRLAHLQKNPDEYLKAQAKMRSLHQKAYDGRDTMPGCCGGGGSGAANANTGIQAPPPTTAQIMQRVSPAGLIPIRYTGRRKEEFYVKGRSTGIQYAVPGRGHLLKRPDGREGVHPPDVGWILQLEGGVSFARA